MNILKCILTYECTDPSDTLVQTWINTYTSTHTCTNLSKYVLTNKLAYPSTHLSKYTVPMNTHPCTHFSKRALTHAHTYLSTHFPKHSPLLTPPLPPAPSTVIITIIQYQERFYSAGVDFIFISPQVGPYITLSPHKKSHRQHPSSE